MIAIGAAGAEHVRPWNSRMSASRQPEAAASRSSRKRSDDEERRARERALECGLEETFPASDPVAILQPSPPAGRERH